MADATRLNRFLAQSGVASRRGADTLVAQRRVTVDGVIVDTPGVRVTETQRVCVDGVAVSPRKPRYLVLNKPAGVVSTVRDTHGRATVISVAGLDERVFPVGRLDAATTGLILLTNDGALAAALMHPSHGVWKTYRVTVAGRVTDTTIRQLARGVTLDDGATLPARTRLIERGRVTSVIELAIREGRNRQVRRMCDAVGHRVRSLERTAYGPVTLGELPAGRTRVLTARELRELRTAAGLGGDDAT
jgi:23S rRNA pseudouridine2605 synthase